jgi:hypothetical protein
MVDNSYQGIPFPFPKVDAPKLTMERSWSLPELAGYLRSWSATVLATQQTGTDPVLDLEREMRSVWGDPTARRRLHWPFTIRAGRVDR